MASNIVFRDAIKTELYRNKKDPNPDLNGSGSGKLMRIRPDVQNCYKV